MDMNSYFDYKVPLPMNLTRAGRHSEKLIMPTINVSKTGGADPSPATLVLSETGRNPEKPIVPTVKLSKTSVADSSPATLVLSETGRNSEKLVVSTVNLPKTGGADPLPAKMVLSALMTNTSSMKSKTFIQEMKSSTKPNSLPNKSLKVKKILFYTPLFNLRDWGFGFGQEPFKRCPVSNCLTSDNRSLNSISGCVLILDLFNFSTHSF